ncbi:MULTISPECIES: hypothetical protein [unclassified Microbacterium]|uniref:hypothetical protein n=1 Tax=unclassified Microbacterium TaxID=2609290 RepID=UPI0012FC05F4|nr:MULTISPECIES: hypothetical protein [unclassified Microbacterium]
MDAEMTVVERRTKRVEITAEVITLVIGLAAAAAAISTLFPAVLTWIQHLPLVVPGLMTVVQGAAIALAAFVRRSDLVKGGLAVLLVVWVPFLGQVIWFGLVILLFRFS